VVGVCLEVAATMAVDDSLWFAGGSGSVAQCDTFPFIARWSVRHLQDVKLSQTLSVFF